MFHNGTKSNTFFECSYGNIFDYIKYCKVASSNMSCIEVHAGFFRLLLKGNFWCLCTVTFSQKNISELVTYASTYSQSYGISLEQWNTSVKSEILNEKLVYLSMEKNILEQGHEQDFKILWHS